MPPAAQPFDSQSGPSKTFFMPLDFSSLSKMFCLPTSLVAKPVSGCLLGGARCPVLQGALPRLVLPQLFPGLCTTRYPWGETVWWKAHRHPCLSPT